MTRKRAHTDVYEFIKSKSRPESNGCITWTGYISNGYGHEPCNSWFKDYKCSRAHQLVYIAQHGNYDRNLEIAHLCNNRACINLEHLKLVPHKENMAHRRLNPTDSSYIDPTTVDSIAELINTKNYTNSQIRKILGIPTAKYAVYTTYVKAKHGLTHHTCKGNTLNKHHVENILQLRRQGEKLAVIANLFNISESMVCRICRGNRRQD